MKHIKYLLILGVLLPQLAFGQKSKSKYSIGISIRPSLYKNQTQFEDQKVFDLAPGLQVESKINEEFFLRFIVQFRQWEKEFLTERTCLTCLENDRIVNNKFTMLVPAVLFSWHKKNKKRLPAATPYINLGFAQQIQLSSSSVYPYSQNEIARAPKVEGFKIDKSYIVLGAGMNYPVSKNMLFFLEPQLVKPLNGVRAWKQADVGITVGSIFRL